MLTPIQQKQIEKNVGSYDYAAWTFNRYCKRQRSRCLNILE